MDRDDINNVRPDQRHRQCTDRLYQWLGRIRGGNRIFLLGEYRAGGVRPWCGAGIRMALLHWDWLLRHACFLFLVFNLIQERPRISDSSLPKRTIY